MSIVSAPRPPKNVGIYIPFGIPVSGVENVNVSWAVDTDEEHPWSSVKCQMQLNDGSWVGFSNSIMSPTVTSFQHAQQMRGNKLRFRLWSENSAGTSDYVLTGPVYGQPLPPKNVKVTRTDSTKVTVSAEASSPYWNYVDIDMQEGDGTWKDVTLSSKLSNTLTATSNRLRVSLTMDVSSGGENSQPKSSDMVVTPWVSGVCAPLAPRVSVRSQVVSLNDTNVVSWESNHPDATEQYYAQVELTSPDGTTSVTDVDNVVGGVEVSGIMLPAFPMPIEDSSLETPAIALVGTYSVRVRTKSNVSDLWGAWSYADTFFAGTPPVVSITSPSEDGSDVTGVPVRASWEVSSDSGLSYQQPRLEDEDGEVLKRWEVAVSARDLSMSLADFRFVEGTTYVLVVVATNGIGLSASDTRTFTLHYPKPPEPMADVYQDDDLAAHVWIANGSAELWGVEDDPTYGVDLVGTNVLSVSDVGIALSPRDNDSVTLDGSVVGLPESAGEPEIPSVYLAAERIDPDGSRTPVGGRLSEGQEVIDPLPPLNVEVTYRVTAFSADGAPAYVDVVIVVGSGGMEAYNFGPGASEELSLGLDASASESVAHTGETFRFALGADQANLPTFYPDGDMDVTGSRSYVVSQLSVYKRLRELARASGGALVWYRDAWGNRAFGVASVSLSYDAKQYRLWGAQIGFTECVWEEPNRGQ
jgi:hypothetical protein